MGTTSTTNLTLVKPNPFEESDTWGSILNANFDKIDALGTVSAKAIAAVTPTADRLPYFTSGTAATVTPFTAFARTLIDDADAAAMQTTLGLGTGDSPKFAAVNIGHATDTTITRSAAGVIAVEGGVVPKENRANTFTQTQTVQRNDSSAVLAVTGDGHNSRIQSNYYGTTDEAALVFSRYKGSLASPTAVTTDSDVFGYVDFRGYDGTAVRTGARILGEVDGTPGANDMPGRLVFLTTPNGSTTVTERLRIDSSGNVLVTGSGGLGYGTGSGGTVTQATDKFTGVTLNKTNGRITMNAAALAAGAGASFSVFNSTVAATDTIIINILFGSVVGADKYNVWAVAAAGSFQVQIKNISAGSLSEAVVLNFAVIKAVTA